MQERRVFQSTLCVEAAVCVSPNRRLVSCPVRLPVASPAPTTQSGANHTMSEVQISVRENGPFLVSGPIELTDGNGSAFDLGDKETIALCRCGASANRPFCDGAHRDCGFESAETAS